MSTAERSRHAARDASPAAPLATKLQPPPSRRRLVERPRLLALLDAETLPKLVLVDAPPGWGKTTLVADWAARTPERRFAWLALDRSDSDPARFWTYVVEALRRTEPGIGEAALTALRVPGGSAPELVLAPLVNELAGLTQGIVLVLDDYHLVTSAEVHEGLAFLVEHLPATLRLVIVTRSDPALPLATLRVRGELAEVRAEQLRFTPDEAAALLDEELDETLAREDVAQLHERTEGWAAGLHLAALSLRGRGDPSDFIRAFAGDDRHLVDYLGSEVLASLPQEVRRFLLRTSILDRFSAPLCDAVAGVERSERLLAEIERSNLFLVPLDRRRRWFRYHHLFGELLRHELEREEPELVLELHRRAAAWLESTGAVPEAIVHATAAGEYARAADLVAAHWSVFLQHGQLDTVTGWLAALPPAIVEHDARLCLTAAWVAVNSGRIVDADRWVESAEQAVAGDPAEGAVALAASAGMLRCIHRYMEGRLGEAIDAARLAQELEPDESSPWRSVGCPVLGLSLFWRGEWADAESTLDRAVRRARPAGNHLAVVHARSCLSAISAERGDWDAADRFAGAAIEFADEHGLSEHFVNALAHATRGRSLARSGRLAEAADAAQRGTELALNGVARVEIGYALVAEAEIRRALGDRAAAQALLGDARYALEGCPDPGVLARMVEEAERPAAKARPSVAPAGELTERELGVLPLLATGLSLREIGGELYVSLNTVKTHARNIYAKLGASSREEAVRRAREAGLL